MARPKRIAGVKTAYERMEDAFWEMLAEMPYHDMTSKELCVRAGVSHNTFYYHFQDLDDVARKALARVEIEKGPLTVLEMLRQARPAEDAIAALPGFRERYRKLHLIAGSGSALLVGLLQRTAMDAWLNAAGIEESDLTPEDRVDLAFVFSGVIGLMGSAEDPIVLAGFPEREVGRGALAKLQSLAQRGQRVE